MEFTIGNLNPSKAKEAVTETSFHDTRRPYFLLLNPLVPEGTNIDRITNLKKEGVKEKKFLWSPRLWVGWRWELILRGPTPFEDMIFYLWTDSNEICTAYVKLKIYHILFVKNFWFSIEFFRKLRFSCFLRGIFWVIFKRIEIKNHQC